MAHLGNTLVCQSKIDVSLTSHNCLCSYLIPIISLLSFVFSFIIIFDELTMILSFSEKTFMLLYVSYQYHQCFEITRGLISCRNCPVLACSRLSKPGRTRKRQSGRARKTKGRLRRETRPSPLVLSLARREM